MSQSTTQPSIRARAVAAPGLLARLAAVLNPHPIAAFDFREDPDGAVSITIRLAVDPGSRGQWHAERVVARLSRVVGVLSVDRHPPPTSAR